MPLQAILFGSIGTIAETSEPQRLAFNEAFRNAGLEWVWQPEEYAQMLSINGGKKRLRHYSEKTGHALDDAQIEAIHADKTDIFNENMKAAGGVTLRPGVVRLLAEARDANVKTGLVSTTSRANLDAMAEGAGDALSLDEFDVVIDESMVTDRKPDAECYRMALEKLGVDAVNAVAIEDTATSMQSPHAAGIATVVTIGGDAPDADYSGAKAVLSDLGEPGMNADIRKGVDGMDGVTTLAQLRSLVGG